jgi:hypothetical protein
MQKAGAAVYQADQHLKEAVKDHAQRISVALKASPLDSDNDALFDDWKTIARLSQTMADIESQLSKAFALASKLKGKGKGGAKGLLKANKAAGKKRGRPAGSGKGKRGRKRFPDGMAGNPAKLLKYLETLLNANDFTVISQSEAGRQTGIPIGSMTAALKRLMELGRISVGPNGGYKLAAA